MPKRPPRPIDQITPGHYRVRLARRGPWVGALIEVTKGTISVVVDGYPHNETWELADLAEITTAAVIDGEAFRHPLLRVAWFGEEIEEADYRHLLAVSRWAREHRPKHPAANPERPVDLGQIPITDLF